MRCTDKHVSLRREVDLVDLSGRSTCRLETRTVRKKSWAGATHPDGDERSGPCHRVRCLCVQCAAGLFSGMWPEVNCVHG